MRSPTPAPLLSPSDSSGTNHESSKLHPAEPLVASRMMKGRLDFFVSKSSSKRSSADSNHDLKPTSSAAEGGTIAGENAVKKQRILFKFNQGFSNAVKRPVTIQDFLL
jgi:hypothetical protein